jgi:RNA recognition motif-containing protein
VQPKIFCYVEYERAEDAERAIKELNGVEFFG